MINKIRLLAAISSASFVALAPLMAQANDEWDMYRVENIKTGGMGSSIYKVYKFNSTSNTSTLLGTTDIDTLTGVEGSNGLMKGYIINSPEQNHVVFGTNSGAFYYDTRTGEFGKSNLTINTTSYSNTSNYVARFLSNSSGSDGCTEVGTGNGSILVCPPSSNKPKGVYVDDNPLIGKMTTGEIHIGENSLITIEEDGVQKLYAKDANGNAIPINITEGTKLLIDGVEVTPSDSAQVEENRQNISTNQKNIESNRQHISTNQKNIESNRQNINDLGFGVAGATALSTAMTALPTVADDSPLSCGVGTGGYSSRYAMSVGCAVKASERLSFNAGGSYVFGGAADYGNGSLSNVAGRAGFVFKLGEIQSSSKGDLQARVKELENANQAIQEENAAIREQNAAMQSANKELMARLERLEAIAASVLKQNAVASK